MKRLVFPLVAAALVIVGLAIGLIRTVSTPATTLALGSGSENAALEPIIRDWAARNHVVVQIDYLGSVDISRALEQGAAGPYDAVWPANSLWIELGNREKVVRHAQSVLRSPVVLGLRHPIAEQLGWIGRDDITVQMIEEAAHRGAFRLSMTSATQSNSGASAYFGFLYALAGNPDVLTPEILADPALQQKVRGLLGEVERSSGSSGWLKDALVANPDRFDAMINYEALVIEANRALAARGEAPLYVVYPANGLAIADSPLAYVDKGDAAKERAFLALQEHLLSPEVQAKLVAEGRRAGLIGLDAAAADPSVWNPDWGIDLKRAIAPIPTPSAEVIGEALRLYQTELRKPSLTVWVLDVSGSMAGAPIDQLKEAMGLLLDPDAAALNLLQPSARDVTMILPFNGDTLPMTTVIGNDIGDLILARTGVAQLQANDGTDLYRALGVALDALAPYAQNGTLDNYLPAIVAMTDGASDTTNRDAFLNRLHQSGFGDAVPIHAIAFGKADEAQLRELNAATIGRLFSAGSDLAGALRAAKGYN